jgi:hypothetical protein
MSNFDESNVVRDTIGRFGTKPFSDAGNVIEAIDPETDYQKVIDAIEANDETFTLVYTAYDDGLTDEQIGWFLSGELGELEESLDDVFSDQRATSAREEAESQCSANGVEWDYLDEDQQQEILDHIYDRDDSDIAGQLIRTTRDKLMRANLFSVSEVIGDRGDLYSGGGDDVLDARAAVLTDALTKRGIDVSTPEAQEVIRGLLTEGPYHWHEGVDVDIIWYGDIADATAGPFGHVDGATANARTLTFAKPHLLIMDRFSGQGWVDELPAKATVTVTQDKPAFLDNDKSKGWGWDATAGVVHSAYRTDVTSEWATA